MSLHKAQKLAKSATDSARFRGHTLGSWTWEGTDRRMTGEAYCKHCKRGAFVDTKPVPNSIDVCGEAVALSCEWEGVE